MFRDEVELHIDSLAKYAAVSSTSQCNTICMNHQEVLYGKDGATWAVRP